MTPEAWTWVFILTGAAFAAMATYSGRHQREARNIYRVRSGRKPRPNWGAGIVLLIIVLGVLLMVFPL